MSGRARAIPLPAPWSAVLLPVSAFPLQIEERVALQKEVLEGIAAVAAVPPPQHHVLLQLWKLGPRSGSDVLSQHVRQWQPDFGMGVWPNREGPTGWTEASLMDAAAAAMQGAEPEMPNHRLLYLAGAAPQPTQASAAMRGFGATVELFSDLPFKEIAARARQLYQPRINEPRFQQEPFYLPLFDSATLQAASSAEQLTSWLCGIQIYVRESAEDSGVLIIARTQV